MDKEFAMRLRADTEGDFNPEAVLGEATKRDIAEDRPKIDNPLIRVVLSEAGILCHCMKTPQPTLCDPNLRARCKECVIVTCETFSDYLRLQTEHEQMHDKQRINEEERK